MDLWRAALTAPGLPPGALAGVGAFADAAAEEALWLQLMRESAEHSPALTDADLVAERAGTWRDAAVRQHTRTLLEAARRMGGAAGDAVTAGAGVVLGGSCRRTRRRPR
ncbi:hypothetical protein ACWCQS_40005 [Streptomyces sp. NPDC002076]